MNLIDLFLSLYDNYKQLKIEGFNCNDSIQLAAGTVLVGVGLSGVAMASMVTFISLFIAYKVPACKKLIQDLPLNVSFVGKINYAGAFK